MKSKMLKKYRYTIINNKHKTITVYSDTFEDMIKRAIEDIKLDNVQTIEILYTKTKEHIMKWSKPYDKQYEIDYMHYKYL